jgi:hypothetical protein
MERAGLSLLCPRLAYLALALGALANGGCLFLALGAAGGAGAAGYAYYKGNVCRSFNAEFADTWAATRTALADLGLPILSAVHNGTSAAIESRTSLGDRIRITLDRQAGELPADLPLTRVGVRVATFGDHAVSNRILDQTSYHLVPVMGPPAPAGLPSGPPPHPEPTWIPAETAPPPLLPP